MSDPRDDDNLGSFYMRHGRPAPEKKDGLPMPLLTLLALAAFAVIIWYAYPRGEDRYPDVDVPVVRADTAVIKSKPEDPGGMQVRHRDSTVFEPLETRPPQREVERLLPRPEEPVNKDQVIAAEPEPQMAETLPLKLEEQEDGAEKVVGLKREPAKEAETKAVAAVPAKPIEPQAAAPVKAEKAAEKVDPPKAEEPKTAKPLVPTGNTYIQLGAFRDAAAARGEWDRLQKKFPNELSGFAFRTEQVSTAKGTLTRLQAGGVSLDHARKICEALKSKNAGGCIVVRP